MVPYTSPSKVLLLDGAEVLFVDVPMVGVSVDVEFPVGVRVSDIPTVGILVDVPDGAVGASDAVGTIVVPAGAIGTTDEVGILVIPVGAVVSIDEVGTLLVPARVAAGVGDGVSLGVGN